jgi:thiol-disulfide isomerase/thioredoxin
MALARRTVIAAAATAAFGAAAIWTLLPRDRGAPPLDGLLEGFVPTDGRPPAPDISFSDAAGNSLSLADFRGKVVLLNLWATWCGPCVEEMPALDRLAASRPAEDFAVVAVSMDRGGMAVITPFLAEHGITTITPYLDPGGRAIAAIGARGLPTSILIGRDGAEIGRLEGAAAWDGTDAKALIDAAAAA